MNDAENGVEVVRVLLCQRSPRLAIALAGVLEKSSLVKVVGRADDPKRMMELVKSLNVDVVLMDADRPGASLLDIGRILRTEHAVGLVLISAGSSGPIPEAMAAGASSILCANYHPRDLILAVVHAAGGDNSKLALSSLPEMEDQMRANSDLSTGSLNTLMDWAARPEVEKISPRLRGTGTLG